MLLPIVVIVAVFSRIEIAVATTICKAPKHPENGTVSYTSLNVDSQLRFECSNGYHLQDPTPVYCTSKGQWSKTDVKCVAKTCDHPKQLKNGQVSYTSRTFRSKLEFKCNDGYFLQSGEPVFCTSDGTWTTTDVRCIAKACDRPEHPENGQVIFTSLNFGSQLTFKCDEGYFLDLNETVFCTSDRIWSRTDVKCVAKTCDNPEHPDNGQVIFTSLNVGSQLKFKCDEGYFLEPNKPVFCTWDGTWNGTDVRCVDRIESSYADFEGTESVAITDQPISDVSEGLEELNDTDDIIEDDILDPDNNDESHKPTETIVNDEEVQETKCGPPPKVAGTLEPHLDEPQASIGTTIIYRCEFGYVNQDSKSFRSICQWDAVSRRATWTKANVVCIPRSCGEPGFVPNAHRIGNLFTFPNKVEFQCEEGYKLKGPAIRYCQASGAWSGRLPKCDQINCDPPANPENGRVRYSSLEYGTELRYECNKGFVLSQHEERTCTADGTWSNTEPVCIEGSCEMPLAPKHGTVQMAGKPKVGTIALYSCKEGTTIVGPSASKCLITGEWTFPPPKCVSPCVLSAIPNGGVGYMTTRRVSRHKTEESFAEFQVGEIFQDGETAIFRCRNRFEPVGSSQLSEDWRRSGEVVTCKDGQWSKSLECKPESCYGEPPSVDNGYPVVNNRSHGSGIYYQCDNYYVKASRDDVKCSYGQWIGEAPRCIDGRCYVSQLNDPGLEKPPVGFLEHEKDYPATCVKGFKASSTRMKISCNTGKLNVIEGTCVPESCYEEPPPVDNGYAVVNNRSHGSGVYYHCDDNYVKASRGDVKCSYGQWSGETPMCIDGRCDVSQLNDPGLEKPTVGFLEHGKDYPATCVKGFKASSTRMKISCNTGKLNVIEGTCVPDTCDGDPPPIDNGLPVVTNRTHGSGIYYSCSKYYVKWKKGNVKCFYGQWTGNTPTCIDGRCYVSQLSHPGLEKPPMNFIEHGKNYPATCMKGFKALYQWIKVSCDAGMWNVSAANCVEVDVSSTPVSPKAEEHVSRQPENCFCIFNSRSMYLAAVVNGVHLEYDSPVKKGDAAVLSCTDPRLHLFWPNGMRTLNANMTCEVCEAWGSSDLPSCELTETGDSFIVLNENVKVQPGGAVASHLNRNLIIGCINWNTNYPDWRTPRIGAESVSISYDEHIVDQRYMLYQSFINIQNFGQQHAGSYECSTRTTEPEERSLRPTKLDLITDCNGEPHEIPHGKYSIQSRSHRSRVEYECDDSYGMTGPSTVQCLYGTWMGQPPQCIRAIPAASVPVGHDVTSTGTPNNPTPKPVATRETSLGEKDDCSCIYNNPDRSLSATYYNRRLWYGDKVKKHTWTRLECANKVMHLVLPNGTKITAGSARLTCRICETWEVDQLPTCERFYHAGLTCPQIVITNGIEVKYSDGRRVGSIATFCCTDSSLELVGRNVKCLENGMWDSNQKPYCQRTPVSDKNSPNPQASKESKSEEDCVCTYRYNWKLKVLVNGERIWRGTNIKKGESIQLECVEEGKRLILPNGTMIMSESVTWTCYRCGAGGASEMPTCEEVQRPGTPVSDKNRPNPQASKESTSEEDCVCTYRYNWKLKALVNGKRIWSGTNIKKGESIELGCDYEGNRLVLPNGTMIMSQSVTWTCYRCGAWGASEIPTCEKVQRPAATCPQLEITEGITVKYTNERRVGSTATFSCIVPFVLHGPSSILYCQQTGVWDRLQPTCRTVTCPQLEITEGITVKYSNERRVGSSVTFNCTAPYVLHGQSTLWCLQNEEWSHSQPICRKPEVRCPQIPETDVFSVQFTNYRKINSTAYFRCKDTDFKIVGGLDTRTCQPSGEWSGANPDCEAPGCLIEDFTETAPRNLVPSMEGVSGNLQPVGSELSMLCEAGYVLTEKKKATCGPLGEWNFGKAQCVVGCQLDIEDESSALIITPYNNYYRIGQSIVVSCSAGFELTSDVERVMCMKNGWSDTIPNCKNETNQ